MNLLTWDILWSPNQKIHTKPAFSALFTSLPSITIAGHHLDILAPFLRLAKTIFPIRLSWNTPDFCLSCHITCTNLQRKKNLVFLQSFSKVNKRVESMKSIQFNIIKNQHSPTAHVEQIIISPPPHPQPYFVGCQIYLLQKLFSTRYLHIYKIIYENFMLIDVSTLPKKIKQKNKVLSYNFQYLRADIFLAQI